jgi:GT2 family glycosyltransferase
MITIVMPYSNRKEQLIGTLKSISLTQYKNFEVVVIDDASQEDQRIEDLVKNFEFKITLVRVEPQEKKWVAEPLALINKIVKECSSEIVIYQCSECLHVGDTILCASENVTEQMCISFGCLNLNEEWSKRIREMHDISKLSKKEELLSIFPHIFEKSEWGSEAWWYNHSIFRNAGLPFCAALTKKFFMNIGGFDEDFSYGINWTDNDFVDRVWKYGKLVIMDNPFVIHQFHPSIRYTGALKDNGKVLQEKRRMRNL